MLKTRELNPHRKPQRERGVCNHLDALNNKTLRSSHSYSFTRSLFSFRVYKLNLNPTSSFRPPNYHRLANHRVNVGQWWRRHLRRKPQPQSASRREPLLQSAAAEETQREAGAAAVVAVENFLGEQAWFLFRLFDFFARHIGHVQFGSIVGAHHAPCSRPIFSQGNIDINSITLFDFVFVCLFFFSF